VLAALGANDEEAAECVGETADAFADSVAMGRLIAALRLPRQTFLARDAQEPLDSLGREFLERRPEEVAHAATLVGPRTGPAPFA